MVLRVERSESRWVRASGQDVSWTSPLGGVSSTPIREETPGQTEDTLERSYLHQPAWERLCVPPEELVEVAGERSFWISLLRPLPARPG